MGSYETFKIFVGNLAPTVRDSDLHDVFKKYGTIVEAVVMKLVTGKNYGFVHMSSESEGMKVLQNLEGHVLHGQRMSVQRSIAKRKASFKKTTISTGTTTTATTTSASAVVGRGVGNLDNFEDQRKANFKMSQGSNNAVGLKTSSYQLNTAPKKGSSAKRNIIGQSVSNLDGFDNSIEITDDNSSSTNESENVKKNVLPNSPLYSSDQISRTNESSNSSEQPSPLLINQTPQSNTPDLVYQDTEFDNFSNFIGSQTSLLQHRNFQQPIHPQQIYNLAPGPITLQENNLHSECYNESLECDVCLVCLCMPPTNLCMMQKHEFMKESKAFEFLRPKLKNLLDDSSTSLRSTMTIKTRLNERMQYTLHSLSKFHEELKIKIQEEDIEQEQHQNSLQGLNDCNVSLLNTNSISDMLTMCRQVETYNHQIANELSTCYAKDVINGALDSILLRLKDSALETYLSHLGFSKDEAFSLSSSLRENADKGNFANVLLIYLLSDLLSFRFMPSLRGPPMQLHSSAHSFGSTQSVPHPLQDQRAPSLPPSQIDRDFFDINKVFETTDAIESMSQLPSMLSMAVSQQPPPLPIESIPSIMTNGQLERVVDSPPIVSSALSLGLSNISLLPREKTPERNQEEESSALQQQPTSYVSAAKKPAKPATKPTPNKAVVPSPALSKPATKFPHCWMTISINGVNAGRVVFQLRPDLAPKMCDNFIGLCTGRSGYGYKGTHFFKSGDGFLVGGDVENDDGSGGYSVFNRKRFEADLCPLKDDVGMVRFRGIGTSENGRGMVGSQFMIWYTERDFRKFSFSLIFGRVVDGLNIVQDIANHNLYNVAAKVEACGAI